MSCWMMLLWSSKSVLIIQCSGLWIPRKSLNTLRRPMLGPLSQIHTRERIFSSNTIPKPPSHTICRSSLLSCSIGKSATKTMLLVPPGVKSHKYKVFHRKSLHLKHWCSLSSRSHLAFAFLKPIPVLSLGIHLRWLHIPWEHQCISVRFRKLIWRNLSEVQ